MSIVPADVPAVPGTDVQPFGEGTATKRLQQELRSTGPGMPAPGTPPGRATPSAPGPLMGGAIGPAPPPSPQQPRPIESRLDPSAVFSPQRTAPQPWRDRLRTWASHPEAGPVLKQLAEQIANQRGPLEQG